MAWGAWWLEQLGVHETALRGVMGAVLGLLWLVFVGLRRYRYISIDRQPGYSFVWQPLAVWPPVSLLSRPPGRSTASRLLRACRRPRRLTILFVRHECANGQHATQPQTQFGGPNCSSCLLRVHPAAQASRCHSTAAFIHSVVTACAKSGLIMSWRNFSCCRSSSILSVAVGYVRYLR